jgi:predicted dehydrogenase
LLRAKAILDSGQVGRLVSLRALVGEHLPDVRPDYDTLHSAQHLGAFDLIHEIDLAVWYAGQAVKDVHAMSGRYSQIGIDAPDLAEILIDFEDRCLASVHLDFFQRPRRRQMELICTDGTIIVEFASWERCTVSVYQASVGQWLNDQLDTIRDDMFRAEDQEFLEAVAQDRPIRATVSEARKSVAILVRAMQTGRP